VAVVRSGAFGFGGEVTDIVRPDAAYTAGPRSRSFRLVIALVPALVFVGLLWFGLARTGSQVESGNSAPSFELPLLDGTGVLTDEDLRGKPVVVNFWASWCIPCREEAPLLERTWRAYRDEGIVFLGVNIKDAKSDAKHFVEEFDITYPIVRDLDQSLTRGFGVRGLPETFFVDHLWRFAGVESGRRRGEQQGTVVLGAIGEDELVTNVERLIRRVVSP
jgi:cytochrome c biogenesis protein CcmG/thiol:disulfide interchange protein DsbE